MRIPLFLSFTATILCVHIEGAVAPSPFLPPGYNSRPTEKPIQSPRNPKPHPPNVQISKEIELGGFFSLGTGESRKLYFSLYNKKVNHAQWVTIGEKTDEDFLAESFDFDTETLTVRFGDSSHDLSLRMSKGTPSGKPGSSNARNIASTTASTPGKPRVMPPRPKTTPTLPPWLANRSASSSSRAGGGYPGSSPARGGTSGLSSASASRATRTVSGGHAGGYVPRPVNSVNSPVVSSPSPGVSSPSRNPSYTGSTSAPNDGGATTPSTNPSSPSNLLGGGSSGSGSAETGGGSSGSEIDLDSLPPPPPPPDILPPGPPPDIIPSRED